MPGKTVFEQTDKRRCHSEFGPPGPYPLAYLDPPSQMWTPSPHKKFLFPNLF